MINVNTEPKEPTEDWIISDDSIPYLKEINTDILESDNECVVSIFPFDVTPETRRWSCHNMHVVAIFGPYSLGNERRLVQHVRSLSPLSVTSYLFDRNGLHGGFFYDSIPTSLMP